MEGVSHIASMFKLATYPLNVNIFYTLFFIQLKYEKRVLFISDGQSFFLRLRDCQHNHNNLEYYSTSLPG